MISPLRIVETASLFPGCFPVIGDHVYLDGCLLRGDNHNFLGETRTCLDFLVIALVQTLILISFQEEKHK